MSLSSSKLVPGRSCDDEDLCLLCLMGEREPAVVQGNDNEQPKVLFFGLLFVYLLVVYVYNVFASYFTLNS